MADINQIASPVPAEKVGNEKLTIEDLSLPRSVVTRLAKGVMSEGTNVQKDSVLAMTKAATAFVNYLAATANDLTRNAGKKVISPQDVLKALEIMELPEFSTELEKHLDEYQRATRDKRTANSRKAIAEAGLMVPPEQQSGDTPPMKKVRGVDGQVVPAEDEMEVDDDMGAEEAGEKGDETDLDDEDVVEAEEETTEPPEREDEMESKSDREQDDEESGDESD
ncbi:hypothetical protein YB2330_001136 [Saitoella coloradoensis]